MYFESTLSIQPKQASEIHRVKPTKFFGKLLVWMTAGLASKKEEHQTYTAVSILQAINKVMRAQGIDNIVRISKDEAEIYYDEHGEKGDLAKGVQAFFDGVDDVESKVFESLHLVLEHEDDLLHYVIDIEILRRHAVGVSPIRIECHGVPVKLRRKADEDATALYQRMQSSLSQQASYDAFVLGLRNAFDAFVAQLSLALVTHLGVQNIEQSANSKMLRPQRGQQKAAANRDHRAVFHRGYHGFEDAFLYAWMWSDLCYGAGVHVHNVTIVDAQGRNMLAVGDEGFDASSHDTLNCDADFSLPPGEDNTPYLGHDYDEVMHEAGYTHMGDDQQAVHVDDHANSMFSFDDGGDSGWSGCSSCSSCGGCGGD